MATNPSAYPPAPHPIAEKGSLLVTRPWLAFFQQLVNQVTIIITGYVTHTGALTNNQVVLGNGTNDIKVLGSYGTAGQVLTSQGTGLAPAFTSLVSVGGAVPYYVGPTETFIVPEFIQSLFEMTITNDGIIQVDGYLIQVD